MATEKTTKQLLYELKTDLALLDGRLKVIEKFVSEVVNALTQEEQPVKSKTQLEFPFMERR